MKISIRVIFVLVYACAIVVIQPESNPYNFIIDSSGFAMSILSSSFLLIFLTSRPPGEKNFINRVLTLIMICFLLNTARCFLLSIAVNLWANNLIEFAETYPTLATIFLSSRCYANILTSLLTVKVSGRLLLYVKPVMFHYIPPITGGVIAGLISLSITTLDSSYWSTCRNWNSTGMEIVETETRLQGILDMNKTTEKEPNITVGSSNCKLDTKNQNLTAEGKLNVNLMNRVEEGFFCYPPTRLVLLTLFLLLDISKYLYVGLKEYKKQKKRRKVNPINVSMKKMPPILKTNNRVKLQRSKSLEGKPKNCQQRRFSLQPVGKKKELSVTKDLVKKNPIKTICQPEASLTSNNRKGKKVSDVLKDLLLRSSSILTLFVLVELVLVLICAINSPASSLKRIAAGTDVKLNAFVLPVALVFSDEDVMSFLGNLFGF